ncbi:formylglycine-generating enzyme family protein [Planctomicrobium sp. SH527]|uniref:formylglycine-generating enzyme family protein n=1 Tax=Planctomicrobium sp. SH527 TaxID=3448123 RepID=UPI003F5CB9D1
MNWLRVLLCSTSFCMVDVQRCTAALPGELLELEVGAKDGSVKIRLRYCPSGTFRAGMPVQASAASELSPELRIQHYYISETEITIGQLKKVLTDSGLASVKESARRMTALPELANAIESGENQPACLVSLDVAVDFCLKLQDQYDADRLASAENTIESRLFRLPSHLEWQYAARAVEKADNILSRPHFTRWIDVSDLTPASQQKCQELWESLGRAGKFPGDQNAFLDISGVTGGEQQEKLKDVLSECFAKGLGAAKRTSSGIGELKPVGSTLPNEWNISDLHDGVTEWTIYSSNQQRAVQLWNRFTTARRAGTGLETQAELFLCGGSFMDSYFGTNALKRFTIWGGPTLTGDHAEPVAASNDLVFDKAPGIRVLMERTLVDDWLFVVRQNVFQTNQIKMGAADFVVESQSLLKDIAVIDHPAERVLQFYLQLILSSNGNDAELKAELKKFVDLDKPQGSSAAGSDLAARFLKRTSGNSGTAALAPIHKDDSAYFDALVNLQSKSSN